MDEKNQKLASQRQQRASSIAQAGSISQAISNGLIPSKVDISLSEAIVLGLLQQNVTKFITVFGHGSTELGEVLRIYENAGIIKTYGVRNEIEAVHAATTLRWVTAEKAAVVTSIGPGALQALAASIAPLSNGLGVWFLMGDETTEDEGPNMQQIPRYEQNSFLKLFSQISATYTLHTPKALPTALRRGMITVDHPYRQAPFFLLMPMNTQPVLIPDFHLKELPTPQIPGINAAIDDGSYARAAQIIHKAQKVIVRAGGGSRHAGKEIEEFLDLADAVVITSPMASGVVPFDHERNMTVAGSKGSISGNFAMENADLLVAIGSRFVCQSDSSRSGYMNVQNVININPDIHAATHYNQTIAFLGDAAMTLQQLNQELKKLPAQSSPSDWFASCRQKRRQWDEYRQNRYDHPTLFDEIWQKEVLTQPAAIKIAVDWANQNDAVNIFDAGDVQANGFQIVEDNKLGRTFTDTGASYMGLAVCGLLATAVTDQPFYAIAYTGDGSFSMNPQILIDGTYHGAKGCILLLDNRRMAAITALQKDQYAAEHATFDHVPVDYVQWADSIQGVKGIHGGYSKQSLTKALDEAKAFDGLSLIHVPVYFGENELGGMGAYGRWNVGNWVENTQKIRHDIGL